MNSQPTNGVLPQGARTTAIILAIAAPIIGSVAGFLIANSHGDTHASLNGLGVGLLAGIGIGTVLAVWTLCLGYVWGDARRRQMPPLPWTLIAALVPNLLGFLLYFVLRRPLPQPCPRCGQPITIEQRFCSWCGHSPYPAAHVAQPPADPSLPTQA